MRAWIWLTSSTVRPLVPSVPEPGNDPPLLPRSAKYIVLPSSLRFIPWTFHSGDVHTMVGSEVLVTSIAVSVCP